MTLIDSNTSAAQIASPADAWTPTRAAARFAADAARIAETAARSARGSQHPRSTRERLTRHGA